MVTSKVFKGSGVYCNGLCLTVISAVIIVVRRNGFMTKQLKPGDTIRHRGVLVSIDSAGITIKPGHNRVEVVSNNRYASHWEHQCIRETFANGKELGGFENPFHSTAINRRICFEERDLTKDGTLVKRNDGGRRLSGWIVVDRKTSKPLGQYEF